ncbi:transmembrane protein 17-like [Apostichopus japonicus]|uniref:transmembrane protein 17-like n=1 Tax=Stichopus japonicus TaxID=307972 RepID=UPI003AB11822
MAADYMRQKLTNFTETVFPTYPTQENRQHHMIRPGNELVSSLPLQIALYFNVYFFPFWLLTCVVILALKFQHLEQLFQFVIITIYIVISGTEAMRLYLGYLGNLQERVPELAGFWLLTLVLQLPLLVFLLAASGGKPTPAEIGVHIIFLIFLLSEIVVGFFALKVMSRQQVMKFHLQEFDDILNPNRDQSESSRYEPLR